MCNNGVQILLLFYNAALYVLHSNSSGLPSSPILCSPSAIMGPRKRGSGSSNVAVATTPSKRCKPTEAETPDKVLAKAKHAEKTFSVIKQCMTLYDDVMDKYGRIDLALDDFYNENDLRIEFIQTHFPGTDKLASGLVPFEHT